MKPPSTRLTILARLLRPIARVCLRYGFSIQDFTEAGKMAFMECAAHEVTARGEKVNVSRLSIMSGLHRRDVMRLQAQSPKEEHSLGVMNRIIGQWCSDPRFSTRRGKPKPLGYATTTDDFGALVHSVSHDLHPGTILFELTRRNLVLRNEDSVTLLVNTLDSRDDDQEGLQMLAEDSYDLALAVTSNLGSTEPLALHSKTEFDAIPVDREDEVRRWMLKKGAAWQREVRTYLASLDTDVSRKSTASTPLVRASFGMFGVVEEMSPNQKTTKVDKQSVKRIRS